MTNAAPLDQDHHQLPDTGDIGTADEHDGINFEDASEKYAICGKKAEELRLGYVRSTIIGHAKLTFGRYNNRPIDRATIASIKSSYESDGVINFAQGSAIEGLLSKSWVEKEQKYEANEQYQLESYPELILSDEGRKALEAGNIITFGGNHRRTARNELLATIEGLLQKNSKAYDEGTMTASDKKKYEQGKERKEQLKEWLFIIYDLDKFNALSVEWQTELGTFLSRNRHLAEKREDATEYLALHITKLRVVMLADVRRMCSWGKPEDGAPLVRTRYNDALESMQAAGGFHDTNRQRKGVAFHNRVMQLLTHVSLLQDCGFGSSGIFSANKWAKLINDGVGSLVAIFLRYSYEATVRLAATTPFTEMSKMTDATYTDEKTYKMFWDIKWTPGSIDMSKLTPEFIAHADSAFKQIFMPGSKLVKEFYTESEEYSSLWDNYTTAVHEQIEILVEKQRLPSSFIARWQFYAMNELEQSHPPIPLFTPSFAKIALSMTAGSTKVLGEIFSYFEPLFLYTKALALKGRRTLHHDFSEAAFIALQQDPIIKKKGSDRIIEGVFLYILSEVNLSLKADGHIIVNSLSTFRRPTTAAEFEAIVTPTLFGKKIAPLLKIDPVDLPATQRVGEPFRSLGISTKDIVSRMAIIDSVCRSSARNLPERTSSDLAKRLSAVSSQVFGNTKETINGSDYSHLLFGLLVESVIVSEFREDMIDSTLFLKDVRSNICALLSGAVIPHSVRSGKDNVEVSHFYFADSLEMATESPPRFTPLLSDYTVDQINQIAAEHELFAESRQELFQLNEFLRKCPAFETKTQAPGTKWKDRRCIEAAKLLLDVAYQNVMRRSESDEPFAPGDGLKDSEWLDDIDIDLSGEYRPDTAGYAKLEECDYYKTVYVAPKKKKAAKPVNSRAPVAEPQPQSDLDSDTGVSSPTAVDMPSGNASAADPVDVATLQNKGRVKPKKSSSGSSSVTIDANALNNSKRLRSHSLEFGGGGQRLRPAKLTKVSEEHVVEPND